MYPRALMRGNPPLTTYIWLLRDWLDLSSLLTIAISVITFIGQDNRRRGKARRSHERAPLPNLTTPEKIAPPAPKLPLIPLPNVISTLLFLCPFLAAPALRRRNVFLHVARKICSPIHSPMFFPSHIISTLPVPVIPPPLIWWCFQFVKHQLWRVTGLSGMYSGLWFPISIYGWRAAGGRTPTALTSDHREQSVSSIIRFGFCIKAFLIVTVGGRVGGFASPVALLYPPLPLLFPSPTAPLIGASTLPRTWGVGRGENAEINLFSHRRCSRCRSRWIHYSSSLLSGCLLWR